MAERGARRGRPKDPAVDEAILNATIQTLAAEGIDGISMDLVAGVANVSKVTIYARYRSKNELIGAALAHLRVSATPPPTGDTRRDLQAGLEHMIEQYDRVGGLSIVGSCLAVEPRSAELLRVIRESTLLPRRKYFREVLDAAVERGELRADIDPERAISALVGAFYADHLAGHPRDPGWAKTVVDLVLDGLKA